MRNWGGNVVYEAETVHRPKRLSELQTFLGGDSPGRALGSRHSFNRIADGAALIDTAALPEFLELNIDRTAVRVNGSMTYGRLVELLGPLRLAVHNLASLPHISIAGAVSTGTHGSGDTNGNLATAVAGIEILTPSGELLTMERGDPEFAGAVVGLGSLGVVISVALDVEPAFGVVQRVYDGLSLHDLSTHFEDVFASGYSVSAFTRWQTDVEQLWVKKRVDSDEPRATSDVLDTLHEAGEHRHPIRELSAEACTPQLGLEGTWADRLPHFIMSFTPSAGEEIQSEYFVGRTDATAAIEAMAEIGDALDESLMISEVRTIAADDLWMSPCFGRDSVAFHFTWHPNDVLAARASNAVGDALAPFAVRPHWGKVFDPDRLDLGSYPDTDRFLALVERCDPRRTLRNDWFRQVFDR